MPSELDRNNQRKKIRAFIIEYFTRDELVDLCFVNFHPLYDTLPENIDKPHITRALIIYCQHRSQIDDLLKILKEARPDEFIRHFTEDTKEKVPASKLRVLESDEAPKRVKPDQLQETPFLQSQINTFSIVADTEEVAKANLLRNEIDAPTSTTDAIPSVLPKMIFVAIIGVLLFTAVIWKMISDRSDDIEPTGTRISTYHLDDAIRLDPDFLNVAISSDKPLVTRSRIDHVNDLIRLTPHLLYTYAETDDVRKLALYETLEQGLFTLDMENNVTYFHSLELDLTKLNDEIQGIIISGNQEVDSIVDITWLQDGFSSLEQAIVLGSNGAVFSYFPDQAEISDVSYIASGFWEEPIAISSYNDQLYVLDRGAERIWKYYLQDGKLFFDEEYQSVSLEAEADLAQATDFDIDGEGNSFVVVYDGGRVHSYDRSTGEARWNEETLMDNGLVVPLVSPISVTIIGRGPMTSVLIADPGSARIIQIGLEGNVLAQYSSIEEEEKEFFTEVSAFDAVELPLNFFVVKKNKLYVLASNNCDPSYPTLCIPPPPPTLNCSEIGYHNFTVVEPDSHNTDRNNNGIGCESP